MESLPSENKADAVHLAQMQKNQWNNLGIRTKSSTFVP
jgi:hypothetical protein